MRSKGCERTLGSGTRSRIGAQVTYALRVESYTRSMGSTKCRQQQTGRMCMSCAVKNIGKPCAGKPHARFDEGGLAKDSMDWLLRHRQTKGTLPLFPQKSKKIPLRTYPSVFVQNSAYSHVNDKVESCPRVLCLTNKITNADYFMTQAITAKRIFHKVCESHLLRYILGSSGYNRPRMPVSPFPVSCFR